jgi:hypothetical protein
MDGGRAQRASTHARAHSRHVLTRVQNRHRTGHLGGLLRGTRGVPQTGTAPAILAVVGAAVVGAHVGTRVCVGAAVVGATVPVGTHSRLGYSRVTHGRRWTGASGSKRLVRTSVSKGFPGGIQGYSRVAHGGIQGGLEEFPGELAGNRGVLEGH